MKRAEVDIKNRLLSQLLLAIFVAYFCNITLFTHSHVIDGVTIVHSHFRGSGHTDSDSAQHTQYQLRTLSQLSHVDCDSQPNNALVLKPNWHIFDVINAKTAAGFVAGLVNTSSLRAPPAI